MASASLLTIRDAEIFKDHAGASLRSALQLARNFPGSNSYFDCGQRPAARSLARCASRIIGIFEHCALGFGIAYLFRESARFLSAVEPMLGIVD
jgi:hypothetical protein